jgi:hypothetical protein
MGSVSRVCSFIRAPGALAPLGLLASLASLASGCQHGDDAEAPAPRQAAPLAAPTIAMVRNEDGGVQVREASQTVVVITGTELASATAVTVGSCAPQILSATATELRVDSSCFGVTRGMISVSVTTPDGTASAPDALLITPFVISPAAPMGGRGTYESPLNLCDPIIPMWSGGGNKLELLGGVHTCGNTLILSPGLVIEGAADGSTVIQGDVTGGFVASMQSSGSIATVVRRLTFAPPLGYRSIIIAYDAMFSGGDVTVEDVSGGRISVANAITAVIDDVSYDGPLEDLDPLSAALDVSAYQLTLSDVSLRCDGEPGIGLLLRTVGDEDSGHVTAARVQVENCGRGVQVCALSGSPWQRQIELRDFTLVDNAVGLDVRCGMVTFRDSEIRGDAMTAQPSERGVDFSNGWLELRDSEIRGQSFAGITQYTSRAPGGPDPVAALLLDGVEIVGAQYGVDFSGWDGGTDIRVRRSALRDQSKACVRTHGYESQLDFGTALDPGGNAFSVLPGGFAIDDVRNDTSPDYFYLDARGTTLNGLSFDTAIVEGPASLPPYFRIARGISGIRF